MLWAEAEKWIKIGKDQGLSGLTEVVMGKKMGFREEFRKQEGKLKVTFYHRD